MEAALILGQGSIGRRHLEVLRHDYPGARLDIVSSHAEDARGVYRNLDAVPDLNSYDYFIIASPTSDHASQLDMLDQKVKGKRILVEKPVFASFQEYKSSDNEVFVGYNLRFHPIIRKLKEILTQERTLSINVIAGQYLPAWRPGTDYRKSYSASRESGGGVLLDLSHEIDYIQWLCSEIVTLSAINRKISDLEISSDDFLACIGMTSTGVIVLLNLEYLSRKPVRRIVVQTEMRTIDCDLINGTIITEPAFDPEQLQKSIVERNYSYSQMHADILGTKKHDACTLKEALDVMKTIERIRDSERNNIYAFK